NPAHRLARVPFVRRRALSGQRLQEGFSKLVRPEPVTVQGPFAVVCFHSHSMTSNDPRRSLVPKGGFDPPRPCERRPLKTVCPNPGDCRKRATVAGVQRAALSR